MIIADSYLRSLVGCKITVLDSNLKEFTRFKRKPQGRIINVTSCGQLVVKWYSTHHPNYLIDLNTDKVHIHAKKPSKFISSKTHCHYSNDHKSYRSHI